jgi:ribosome-associated protein
MRSMSRRMAEINEPMGGTDGAESNHWVVIDLGDVIVHLFDPETRRHYNLEALWGDAKLVDMANLLTVSDSAR